MKTLHVVVSIGIASLLSAACNNSSSGPTPAAGSAASAAPTASTPTAPAASATAAAGGALAISATCTTKLGARMLGCTEYNGKLPDGAEASCKKDGGTFTSGATPCSTADAIGKCAHAATATASQVDVSYKTSVGDAKGSCEALGNAWTALGAAKK